MSLPAQDLQSLDAGAIVDLFELDPTLLGGTIVRWHADVNELGGDVVWQGQTYARLPIEASGFEWSGRGPLPRPTLRVANVSGLAGALARSYQDLVGAKVIRRRTLRRYLDAVNFADGNPSADPAVHMPDEVYYVHRKAAETKVLLEFELAAAWDVHGVQLPRRQVIANICPWRYRGPECGYTGTKYFTAFDVTTTSAGDDVCGKRLASCRARFGKHAELPFGGFPGAGLVR
ncbi:MAG: phage minor tail protein L [Gammaproteobacteria bacterium]|nr:phage minor tail protein L [Gammaproteobacteria bacterium]